MKNAIADLALFLSEWELRRATASQQAHAEMQVLLAVKMERVRKQHGQRGVKPKATHLRYGEIVEDGED